MDILELNNHLILSECFKKHLKEDNKPKTYSYSNSTFYKDRCCCKFYEWSNLSSNPLIFNRGKDFFEFLDKCNIKYTENQRKEFDIYYSFYATCIKGKSEVIIEKDKVSLELKLNSIG